MNRLEGTAVVFPGQQIKTLARLIGFDGALIDADDISTIRLQGFEPGSNDAMIIGAGSLTGIVIATSAAAETLSTAGGWSADAKGYNFSHTYDTSTFLKGGRSYRLEYRITTSSLGVLFVIVNVIVLPTGQEPA